MDILSFSTLPERLDDVAHLDEVLTRPSEALIEDMARLDMVWRSNVGKWDTEEQFISGL